MSEKSVEKKRTRFRIDIIAIVAVVIFVLTFCAYMINTRLEDVLAQQRGGEIVTHDYTFEDSSQAESN